MMLKFDNTTANMQTALGIIHSNTIIINVNTLTKYFHPTSPSPIPNYISHAIVPRTYARTNAFGVRCGRVEKNKIILFCLRAHTF